MLFFGMLVSSLASSSGVEAKLRAGRAVDHFVRAAAEVRVATDGYELVYRHGDLGVQVQGSEGLVLALHYRGIKKQSRLSRWLREDRLYLQAEKKFALANDGFLSAISFSIRERVEFRSRENKPHAKRSRLRLKIKSKKLWFDSVRPFLSNELFYNIDEKKYTMNRFDVGFSFSNKASLKQHVYLKFQSRRKNQAWLTNASLAYALEL